jgi:hypothetical protein
MPNVTYVTSLNIREDYDENTQNNLPSIENGKSEINKDSTNSQVIESWTWKLLNSPN